MIPLPPVLHAAVRFGRDEITVALGGEIDYFTAPKLAAVFDAVAGQGPSRVIVDLADVEFMGAAGVNLIVRLASQLRAAHGEVVLRSPSNLTGRVLDLMNLGDLVDHGPAAVNASDEFVGASVRPLEEMRPTSSRRRERTIDAALGAVVAWAEAAITSADSISVTLQRRGRLTTAASNGEDAARLDGHQYATGEGPCVDATTHGQPALVPCIADESRWPQFRPHALDAGIRAILSTPITVESAPVGALNLYSRAESSFGADEQHIAGVITQQAADILAGKRGDLNVAERSGRLDEALRTREVIAQAQGIVMHRDGISADAAAARLHRQARRANIPLGQLAAQLVAHTGQATDPSHGG